MKTIIIGKNSSISKHVNKNFKNSFLLSANKLMTWDLSNKSAWEDFKFEGSVYIKSEKTTFDYNFKSTICIAPLKKGKLLQSPKDKKEYNRWIKRGY
jgi:hypothetical protein